MVSPRKGESREAYLERGHEYRQNHKEEQAAYHREYYQTHRGEIDAYHREYRQKHKEKYNAISRKYYQNHKKERNTYCREYRQKHPEAMAKHNAKRKRNLGYILLNDWFEDCHGHHIDMNQVIYIPADLHRSVYHNISTGQGMEEMNALALAYWAGSEMT